MQSAFLIVVVAVGAIGLAGALLALALSGRAWESLDRDRMLMDSDLRDPRAPRRAPRDEAPGDAGERQTEIRQLLEARNERRRRHGAAELDVEDELARLLRAPAEQAEDRPVGSHPQPDPELVAEIRELVLARNHRLVRRGRPPLDVEAEIERQITRLNG